MLGQVDTVKQIMLHCFFNLQGHFFHSNFDWNVFLLGSNSSPAMAGAHNWYAWPGYQPYWGNYPNQVWYPRPIPEQIPFAPTQRDTNRRAPKQRKESSSMSADTPSEREQGKARPPSPASAPVEKDSPNKSPSPPSRETSAPKQEEPVPKRRERRRRGDRKSSDPGQRRPPSPPVPPRKERQQGDAQPPSGSFESEEGQVKCPVCSKWVSCKGYDLHRQTNLKCKELEANMKHRGEPEPPRPTEIWYDCAKCGKWLNGAYAHKMHWLHKHKKQDRGYEGNAPIKLRPARSRTPSSRSHQGRSQSEAGFASHAGSAGGGPPGGSSASVAPATGEDRAEALADLFEATSRVLRSHKKS